MDDASHRAFGDSSSPSSADAGASCGLLYLIGQDTGAAPDPAQPVILYSFDPQKPALTKIGAIPCITAAEEFPVTVAQCAPPTTGGCSTAMTVDAQGTAWIFSPWIQGSAATQKAFAVNTRDASCIGSPLSVQGHGYGVTGAAIPTADPYDAGTGRITVVLEDVSSPSGVATFGDFDTQSGAVDNIRAAVVGATSGQNPDWFFGGNAGSYGLPFLWNWPSPVYGPMLVGFDTACEGAASACANGLSDGGPAPDGTPIAWWEMPLPQAMFSASKPWTTVWAAYLVASTTNAHYTNDFYTFTPGWFAGGHREVYQINVAQLSIGVDAAANDAAVHLAMSDLGVNAFAATSGPQCPPSSNPPPPPPTQ